jgi:hypothetical protein
MDFAAPPSFTRLLGTRENLAKAVRAFERVIAASFDRDSMHKITRDEVKRRFDLCVKIFTILVGDCKWGVERALGRLGEYLRMELSGTAWEPDKRTFWMPTDGGE